MKKTPNSGKKIAVFITTLALGYLSMRLLFNSADALIMMVSILLHEVGHFVVLRYYGYTAGMIFVPFLGAAVYPDDKERFSKAPRMQEMFISAAGPMVNIILMFMSLAIYVLTEHDGVALASASLNASLATLNLLPFGFFDGGRMARALYASADEHHDRIIARKLTAAALAGALIVMVLSNGLILMPALFIIGSGRASTKDDPDEWKHPRSMSNKHSLLWACVWGGMILSGIVVSGSLKFWHDY